MGRYVLVILLTALPALIAQTQQPTFEVAEVKLSKLNGRGKGRVLPGGRVELPGVTLRDLIALAYGMQEELISGGPDWVKRDRFDVVAKAPADMSPETMRPMFQSLLVERFKLAIHRD